MTDALTDTRIERIDREIDRLGDQLRALDRDWRNAKHSLWLGLLAIPALFLVGYVGMVLVVFAVFSLYASCIYLIGVRRREYVGLIADCRKDKESIERRRVGG